MVVGIGYFVLYLAGISATQVDSILSKMNLTPSFANHEYVQQLPSSVERKEGQQVRDDSLNQPASDRATGPQQKPSSRGLNAISVQW